MADISALPNAALTRGRLGRRVQRFVSWPHHRARSLSPGELPGDLAILDYGNGVIELKENAGLVRVLGS
jgi:hypothetical protein